MVEQIKKVAFIDTVHPYLWDTLTSNGYTCLDFTTYSYERILNELNDISGIVIRSRFRMDASVLDRAPQLKFIARAGAGLENIDIAYCEKRFIELLHAPEGNRNAVAEQALGMLLCLFNNIIRGDAEVRNGIWDRERNRGYELEGKTIGLIGYGNNGSQFAKILAGFDTRILVYDKYKNGFGNERVEEVSLKTLMEGSDIISLHIPQTEETLQLINAGFIEKVSKPFYLINLSRGKIVDTNALVDGLRSGKVKGACLDVLEYEKSSFECLDSTQLPDAFQYLVKSDKVILSPHVGGWTHESNYKLSKVLADKILT